MTVNCLSDRVKTNIEKVGCKIRKTDWLLKISALRPSKSSKPVAICIYKHHQYIVSDSAGVTFTALYHSILLITALTHS